MNLETSKNLSLDLPSLLEIGLQLYSMISKIYEEQFRASDQTKILDSEATLTDLLLAGEGFDTSRSSLFKTTSFLTVSTNETNYFDQNGDNLGESSDIFNDVHEPFFENFCSSNGNSQNKNDDDFPVYFFKPKKLIQKEKTFMCKFCGNFSKNKQQLGGHISKNHPGKGANASKRDIKKKNQEYRRIMKESILGANNY